MARVCGGNLRYLGGADVLQDAKMPSVPDAVDLEVPPASDPSEDSGAVPGKERMNCVGGNLGIWRPGEINRRLQEPETPIVADGDTREAGASNTKKGGQSRKRVQPNI